MARTLTGTLKAPLGAPVAAATLNFIAVQTAPQTIIQGVSASTQTDGDGAYSLTLEDGVYSVELTNGKRTYGLGRITVEAGADTTLNALLTV